MSQNPNPEQYNQYSQQAPSYSQAPGQQPNGYMVSSKDDQNMAMLAHLASAILSLLSFASASILAPLVMWFIYKDRSPFVRAAGAFNFNLGMWLVSIVAWISLFTVVLIPLAIILFIVSTLGMFILHIVAAVKASRGEVFNYPFQLRVLS